MRTIRQITAVLFTLALSPALAQQEGNEAAGVHRSTIQFRPFTRPDNPGRAAFQFSFVPYVGTNGVNSGDVINDVSINVLGGYSAGTGAFEMAGLFNINRGEMTGAQFAGLFNQVGARVEGAQFAGLFNSNLGEIKGAQFAGLANFTTGGLDGFQAAGLANFSPKTVTGVQMAGLMNFSGQHLDGTQISGGLNFVAKEVNGSQIGLVNYGGVVRGFQLGLLNYADSMSGVPVGLLTVVKSGYHTLELSANEVIPLNIAFRTGKREFYNILFAGIRPEIQEDVVWTFGYGLGTSPRLANRLYLNIEATAEQLNEGNVQALNLINRGYVGAEFQVKKGFAVFAGPTVNFRVFDDSYAFHPELFRYTDTRIRRGRSYEDDISSQFWWGFKAGMRFF